MSAIRTDYARQIAALADASRRLGELGYVASHGGNLSFRVCDELILITPTKVMKRLMRPEDIVVVSLEGEAVDATGDRRPTGETPMHLMIFRYRPDLNAIVHAHPPYLTGFSMVETDLLERPLLPEPVLELGPIVRVPYAEPISQQLADQFAAHLHRSNAWLMQNHGVTIGSSEGIERALEFTTMAEAMAQSAAIASSIGSPSTIPAKEVANMERTLATRSMPRPGDPRQISSLMELYGLE